MFSLQTFWWAMTLTCVVWFSTVTIYVAVRGGLDIKHMLARLDKLALHPMKMNERPLK